MSLLSTTLLKLRHAYKIAHSMLTAPGMVCMLLTIATIIGGPIALTAHDSPFIITAIQEYQLPIHVSLFAGILTHAVVWLIYCFKLTVLVLCACVLFIILTMIVYGASLGKINLFEVIFTKDGINQLGEMISKRKE